LRPYLKKTKKQEQKQTTSQKRAGRVAQGVEPEFKPQYCKKKKNQNRQTKPKTAKVTRKTIIVSERSQAFLHEMYSTDKSTGRQSRFVVV
jgi:hypothetical protein